MNNLSLSPSFSFTARSLTYACTFVRAHALERASKRVHTYKHHERASARGNELPPSPSLPFLLRALRPTLCLSARSLRRIQESHTAPSASLVLPHPPAQRTPLDATSTPSPSRVRLGNESPRARPRAIPPVPPSSPVSTSVCLFTLLPLPHNACIRPGT